jgi:ribosomal protein S18 acetylase RimI-like enzyme
MQSWQLRGRSPEDEAFLLQLYASMRAAELCLFPWSAEQKALFVSSQYQAREQSRRLNYATAVDQVILVNGSLAGRFLVWREHGAIGLLEICLLPEYRNQGIGSALIGQLLEEGQRLGQRVWLHVAADNWRAMQLYHRLGFCQCDQTGLHVVMEHAPESNGSLTVAQ